MSEFIALRRSHQHTQTNDAPPERVFPLLCPAREAEWVPGWKYRLIYSESGVAEDGCVFTTPNDGGPETVWMVTHYDPSSHRIAFAWVQPGLVATQLRISLSPAPGDKTYADIRYVYTALSPEGNTVIERYTPEWFQNKMQGWETAINHFLRTGKLLEARAWE
ncbi:MAG: SRPBCC family protein [Acidobacteriota bacterium]